MTVLPSTLMTASAAVMVLLGVLHLFYTFIGNKLHPRDAELRTRLEQGSPMISRQTTMWKVWVGCNASHSYGLLLFGAVYGYLALLHGRFLFQSWFLLMLGLFFLAGFAFLAKHYWFRVPFRAILSAIVFYMGALVMAAFDLE